MKNIKLMQINYKVDTAIPDKEEKDGLLTWDCISSSMTGA